MADNTGYDDAGFDNDEQREKNDRSVRWSTVALSVGLSALASAVVIGVGATVMFANAKDPQVTLVQDAGTANTSGVTSKKDANTTTAKKAPTTGAKPTSTAAAGSGSNGSNSTSGGPARINGGGGAPIDDPSVGGESSDGNSDSGDGGNGGGISAQSLDGGVPAQPSNAELKTQMETILANGASDETIAANLENPAGVQSIRDAGAAMRAMPIFRYEMVDPVVVEGNYMTATIQMSMVGLGSKPPADLFYVAKDGKWVLTDESVCLIASQARVACTV